MGFREWVDTSRTIEQGELFDMHKLNDEILRQLDAFDKWLNDVYNEETSFSTLLTHIGFSEAEIEELKQEHLSEFLQAVLDLLGGYTDLSNEGLNMLMLLHYGLSDGKPQSLKAIGDFVGVSPERIRQLVNKRMNLYRDPKRQAKFQNDFAAIGWRLLLTLK